MPSPAGIPLVEELQPVPTVVQAMHALRDLPRLLVLDSALQRRGLGRYSFMTADPITVWQQDAAPFGSNPFGALQATLDPWIGPGVPELPPFQGGIAGLLGYELGGCFERIPRAAIDDFQIPVLAAGWYDWVLAWDHEQQRAWLISQGWPETRLPERHDRVARRRDEVLDRLARAAPTAPDTAVASQSVPPFAPIPLPESPGVFSNFSRPTYLEAVRRVIEYIRAGDIFQANLTQRLSTVAPCDSVELFERLRRVNPAPFSGLLQWDDWAVISASPERFLRVDGDHVETRPIKGTRKRRQGPEADLFTRDELRESEKDYAENVMIVDLLRNDLSRACEAGSVRVPQLCGVETYETVQHLVSEVRGRLRSDQTVWSLLRATFPGGSITGAPKVRAMEIIGELETVVRGPYCGCLFYAGTNGQFDSNLLIRTFVQRGGWLSCGVGGGIVAQSHPDAEYEETLVKAAGMLRALKLQPGSGAR